MISGRARSGWSGRRASRSHRWARDLGTNEGTLGNWVNADKRRRQRALLQDTITLSDGEDQRERTQCRRSARVGVPSTVGAVLVQTWVICVRKCQLPLRCRYPSPGGLRPGRSVGLQPLPSPTS
jgi:hypothetical protein